MYGGQGLEIHTDNSPPVLDMKQLETPLFSLKITKDYTHLARILTL